MNAATATCRCPAPVCAIATKAPGRAVVFVHGWTLDLDIWEPQAPLAAELRVVRYDRRGFGLSTGQPSLTRRRRRPRRAADRVLGIVSPLLVGMSQGARVVLEFAARHPGRRRAAWCSTARRRCSASATVPTATCRWNRCASWRRAMASRRSAAPGAMHPLTQLVTGDARMRTLLARILARYPGNDLLARQPSRARPSIDALLAQIRVPVLIVNGARDTETPAPRRCRAARRAADAPNTC